MQEKKMKQLQQLLKKEFAARYKMRPPKARSQNKNYREHPKKYYQPRSLSLIKQPRKVQINSKYSEKQNCTGQQQLSTTLKQLNCANHHKDAHCLCSECTCGRHLCKLGVIKPNMSKSTVYQQSFKQRNKREGKADRVILVAEETEPLRGNHLNLKSQYIQVFQKEKGTKGRIQKPRPKDMIMSHEGTPQSLTNYNLDFPGHKGSNQYVKPTNKAKRGEFPFSGKTIYSTQFMLKRQPVKDYTREGDHLKTGLEWMGLTTYDQSYTEHNPETVLPASPYKLSEIYSKNPDYAHQFQTQYKKEFLTKNSPICPSKIYLQKQVQSATHKKQQYLQNTDFKAMSPTFQAISNSKHFYV